MSYKYLSLKVDLNFSLNILADEKIDEREETNYFVHIGSQKTEVRMYVKNIN